MSSRSKLGEPDSQQGFSVVFDAVALLPSQEGVVPLCQEATARDFLADAFAHLKFIGYVSAAAPLFERAAVPLEGDEAIIALDDPSKVAVFVEACSKLRHWERESEVKLPLAAE